MEMTELIIIIFGGGFHGEGGGNGEELQNKLVCFLFVLFSKKKPEKVGD